MLFSRKPEVIVEVQKPAYGKVIALTALAVAAVEAAAFIGLLIAKKIADEKLEKELYDEDFELAMEAGEISVEFEQETEETPETEEVNE